MLEAKAAQDTEVSALRMQLADANTEIGRHHSVQVSSLAIHCAQTTYGQLSVFCIQGLSEALPLQTMGLAPVCLSHGQIQHVFVQVIILLCRNYRTLSFFRTCLQDGHQQQISQQTLELQHAQSSLVELEQVAAQHREQAAALQSDLHSNAAALAELVCTAQSCTQQLQHLHSGDQSRPVFQTANGDSEADASEDYLVKQAAAVKESLAQACETAVVACRTSQAQESNTQQVFSHLAESLCPATSAMQQHVLPSLALEPLRSPALCTSQPAGQCASKAVVQAAACLTEIVQQAVVGSANLARQLAAACSQNDGLKSEQQELQGVQTALRAELLHEQVVMAMLSPCTSTGQCTAWGRGLVHICMPHLQSSLKMSEE